MEDFLRASSDASARTRNVLVLLIIASVVTAVGIRNSMQSSWMMHRLEQTDDARLYAPNCAAPQVVDLVHDKRPTNPDDLPYWGRYIGCAPTPSPCKGNCTASHRSYDYARQLYADRYESITEGASIAALETRFFVHAPVLGVVVDVNDLGYVSGVVLTLLLIWFFFSLETEEQNFELFFHEAESAGDLDRFYKLLAVRQVIASPERPYESFHTFKPKRLWGCFPIEPQGRMMASKLLIFLPLAVYIWLSVHDFCTLDVAKSLGASAVILTAFEALFSIWMIYLTFQVLGVLSQIDSLWSYYANKLRQQYASTGTLADEV